MSQQNKKKLKPANVITDCVIAGIVIVLAIVIGTSFLGKDNSKETTAGTETSSTPKPAAKEQGVTRYACAIAQGSSNNTIFYVEFNSADKTFTETIQASSQTSKLDQGSYEQKDGKLVTTSATTKKQLTYVKDGDYLIVESEMYQGTLPDGDTFDGTFTYEVKDECKRTVTFKKDGTYEQTIVSYAKAGTSDKDSTATTTGKYNRDGKFINRTADDSESLIDFYIYDHRISNAYYKLEK